jgi:TolA-binding protein
VPSSARPAACAPFRFAGGCAIKAAATEWEMRVARATIGRLAFPAWGVLWVLAGAVLPTPASAQIDSREAIQLQNQMLELRRDMQLLREQVSRMGSGGSSGGSALSYGRSPAGGSAGGGEMTAALLDRVGQLEDHVRRLQGRLDEVDNARQRQGEDLKKDLDDLNFKIGAGAGTAARPNAPAASPATPPTATPATPPTATPRRTPEVAMQEGNAALARRDYNVAEAAAREVLAFPRSPRAGDAQFLLAQALSGKRDWQAAAVAYDDAYNRNKTGGNAQSSLLGLANALTNINEKRAACATLDKLRAEFPSLRADMREPVAAMRQKAGCR